MVVDGIPDPKRHKLCRRCQRWFEPDEGELHVPEVTGPVGAMRASRAGVTDDLSGMRFQCHRCTRVRRRTQFMIFAALFGIIALALLLEQFGLLH